MIKHQATVAGTVAILALALLFPSRAEAGASASAPSKYVNATQVASGHQVRTDRLARSNEFGITEYSSSSAKHHSPQR